MISLARRDICERASQLVGRTERHGVPWVDMERHGGLACKKASEKGETRWQKAHMETWWGYSAGR
ncbi:hypothetical protein KAM343_04740 [Aeromonas caviae]|uniref:Integrase n=1 Tax=Aeromonas caviae TaxID=648 RepID=A0AAV4YFA3_AERCA|nr:hypothetical protein KAM343_04740 [Aeromonas caviae]